MIQSETQPREPAGAIPERVACAIKLPVFEGPLDLLLHLIRINEVDIADIPIAEITEQYLAYLDLMRSLDIDIAADYLVMAATLAYIKSRMLLPSTDAEDDEGEDPRAELARRLAEYAVFKEAGEALGERPILGRDVFAASVECPELPEPEPVLDVSVFELLEALRRVLAQVPPESRHHEVNLERVTIQDRMIYVMDRLQAAAEGVLLFEELLVDAPLSRPRLIATFLAILELARVRALRVFQNQDPAGFPAGPVRVRLAVAEATSPTPENA